MSAPTKADVQRILNMVQFREEFRDGSTFGNYAVSRVRAAIEILLFKANNFYQEPRSRFRPQLNDIYTASWVVYPSATKKFGPQLRLSFKGKKGVYLSEKRRSEHLNLSQGLEVLDLSQPFPYGVRRGLHSIPTAWLFPVEVSTNGKLLTPDEVAERLGTHKKWVYRHAGELGAIRLSRRAMRFTEAGVTSYLERYGTPMQKEAEAAEEIPSVKEMNNHAPKPSNPPVEPRGALSSTEGKLQMIGDWRGRSLISKEAWDKLTEDIVRKGLGLA